MGFRGGIEGKSGQVGVLEGRKTRVEEKRRERQVDWRTFLDLSFLHLVVDGLLEVSFVTVGKSVDVDLRLPLIHLHFVWQGIRFKNVWFDGNVWG